MFKNTFSGLKKDINLIKKDSAEIRAKAENKVLPLFIRGLQKTIMATSVRINKNQTLIGKQHEYNININIFSNTIYSTASIISPT